jgi:DNA repair exonuclease SbcCD ATPase subunit
MAYEIEKKSLEAHVEICAVRYENLEQKLESLESRMDKVEEHLVDIKDKLANSDVGNLKTFITIGTTILGVLVAGIITLLTKFM